MPPKSNAVENLKPIITKKVVKGLISLSVSLTHRHIHMTTTTQNRAQNINTKHSNTTKQNTTHIQTQSTKSHSNINPTTTHSICCEILLFRSLFLYLIDQATTATMVLCTQKEVIFCIIFVLYLLNLV